MSQPDTPSGDPWMAFGYLTSGVLLYGAIGWGLDRWWGTGFMVVVGILLGAGLGLYQTFARFRMVEEGGSVPPPDAPDTHKPTQS